MNSIVTRTFLRSNLAARTSLRCIQPTFTNAFTTVTPAGTAQPSTVQSTPLHAPIETQIKSTKIPFTDSHAYSRPSINTGEDWTLPHNIWNRAYLDKVEQSHRETKDWVDRLAYNIIKMVRFNFDWMSGYSFGKITKTKALTRCVFLETIAGIPGSIGGTLRHLHSLRRMKRDYGWIHTLLEEAENEKQHLLTFIQLRNPGIFLRSAVFVSQGIFFNFFFLAYLISPRFCHRLVGYLEEQAVHTYTVIVNEIDNPKSDLHSWSTELAPPIAVNYWQLGEKATIRDLMLHIRADEAHHRDVNHTFGSLKEGDQNPFLPGR